MGDHDEEEEEDCLQVQYLCINEINLRHLLFYYNSFL